MPHFVTILCKRLLLALAFVPSALAATSDKGGKGACPLVKMEVERLPDLNIARAGHQVLCLNGEYVVAGGHTDGFVPTPTAEYFKNGQWHTIQMVYNHDFGCSAVLKSGKVLLAGGCPEPLGIGQSFVAEIYDPVTHTFKANACLDQKRAVASALELDNGSVVIAGNWYHDDTIEMFDGKKSFTHVRGASVARSGPFIFQTAPGDAIVFSGYGNKGDSLRSSTADKLSDGPMEIPLFEQWLPFCSGNHRCAESFIGDMQKGIYTYLLPMIDKTGRVAIAKIENGEVTLLPTQCPVPTMSRWGGIKYFSAIVADQKRGRAYLIGHNADIHAHTEKGVRLYVLCIDYTEATSQNPAPLTLYYTTPLPDGPDYTPTLTPDGQLLLAGGFTSSISNFSPSRHAYLLHVSNEEAGMATKSGNLPAPWWWALPAGAIVLVVCVLTLKHRQRKVSKQDNAPKTTTSVSDESTQDDTPQATTSVSNEEPVSDLMQRIYKLMEEEKPYLNSELKVSDIANIFDVHRNDISACINSQTGYTFAQFINYYRIDYAKKLMLQEPNKKILQIWIESGFGSEQTFFKTFRIATGMSPKEWMAQQDS